jgi:glucosamine-6-phosphate deaminase
MSRKACFDQAAKARLSGVMLGQTVSNRPLFSNSKSMRVKINPDKETASRIAAQIVAKQVRRRPNCVLGLATGSSPLLMYQELIRMHHEEGLDFSAVTTFNLDEYVGLHPGHEQSYHHFMHENLFNKINIPNSQINIPDGRALDFDVYCAAYERQIAECGGIDLQILGIGSDGHVAFNEPGSSLGSRTRIKTLASETVRDNARYFGDAAKVPRLAITMGVGTILESRQCLLLAFGKQKSQAIHDAIEGPITAQVTASALQLHRDVICVLDADAATLLQRTEYYRDVDRSESQLEQAKLASQLQAEG